MKGVFTDFILSGYSDADWGGDLESRRSTTGYVFFAAGGPIAWQSKLQFTVAVSPMEAEYMAAFCAIQKLIKWVSVELGFNYVGPITVFVYGHQKYNEFSQESNASQT